MITRKEYRDAQKKAVEYLKKARIAITSEEKNRIEVVDLGLGRLNEVGLEIVVYENNDKYCAKELILLPRQICPEHRHPDIGLRRGKMETFRCRWGEVHLYVPGRKTRNPRARIPNDRKPYHTVWHEIILKPGHQYTVPPDTLHWFQGGKEGAVVSEFSTTSVDEKDIFTDPNIERTTKIE